MSALATTQQEQLWDIDSVNEGPQSIVCVSYLDFLHHITSNTSIEPGISSQVVWSKVKNHGNV